MGGSCLEVRLTEVERYGYRVLRNEKDELLRRRKYHSASLRTPGTPREMHAIAMTLTAIRLAEVDREQDLWLAEFFSRRSISPNSWSPARFHEKASGTVLELIPIGDGGGDAEVSSSPKRI